MSEHIGKFSFFASFWEAASDLADNERLALYDAMCAYAFKGEEPGFSGVMSTIWKLVKPNLDSSIKGQRTGGKGGRPKAGKPPVSESENPPFRKGETPVETDMDMDMDMEVDMDRDREAEGFSSGKKNPSAFPEASGGAVAGKPAPPSAYCPVCDVKMWKNTQTGKFTCSNCLEAFPKDKAVWR